MSRFTAQFTTRKTYQDTNKVYNQETTKIPKCTTRKRTKIPKCTTRKRYQGTNKVYNQEKVPRYQQVYNRERKKRAKVPTKCTCCWYLGLLSW